MLICPICKEKLELKNDKTYYCKNNHCFDKSKYAYVNLLVNKTNNGDNKEMVESRYNFLKLDYYLTLALKLKEIIKDLNVNTVLDIGCGEGYYDRCISSLDINLTGIDISKDAILKASKLRCDNLNYVVASSFNLPFSDNSFDLSMSIFSPINESEVKRVTNKYFIKVIPNKKHLLELKEELYETVYLNDVPDSIIEGFELIDEISIDYFKYVENMNDLFKMTPYYYTTHDNFNLDLKSKNVNFSFLVRVYKSFSI